MFVYVLCMAYATWIVLVEKPLVLEFRSLSSGPVPLPTCLGPSTFCSLSLSLSPTPRHCRRPSPCLCVGALGWLRRSPRGTDLCEKVLFSCARCLRAPRSCLKLLDLLLCCCVHPCELAAWRKSISQLLVIGS